MSLKAFHVVFIAICLLLCMGLGAWGVRNYLAGGEISTLYIGAGSLSAGVGLGVYGLWFLKKLRNVSFI